MDEPDLVPLDSDSARQLRTCDDSSCGPLNIYDFIICLLIFLLFLGFLKAILGLMCSCVGTIGMSKLLMTPCRLDEYHESELQGREVEYDEDGWPIHPDTRKRSVLLVSWPIQFLLNLIFFICVPVMLLYHTTKDCKCTRSHRCGSEHCHIQGSDQREPLLRGVSSRSTSSFTRRQEDSSAIPKSKSSKSRSKWRGLSGSSN